MLEIKGFHNTSSFYYLTMYGNYNYNKRIF